ncbi:MAG: (d)CMP kinase [bacterium]|nr:(d)CMP kinase [bacterium]
MGEGKRIVVAIDGPAGAGKSTIAKRIAARLGFLYIDTGAMYRAVGLWALRIGVALDDMHRLEQLAREATIELISEPPTVKLNGEEVTQAIRAPEVSDAASKASAVPGVRRALVAKQRQMGEDGSVVMEGRDIGSVVFPNAQVKVFLDASPSVRAKRRLRDLDEKETPAQLSGVEKEMEERDRRDSTRADSPLVQAPDAVYVDTTPHSLGEVEEIILKIVRERTSNGKELAR